MKHYFSTLEKQIALHADKKALCDYNGDSFTYGQVATLIEKMHLLFGELGIKKGDKIAICARNQARWGISFLAANTYEAVVVPILADFTPESIESLINHSETVFLFTDAEIWKKLDGATMPQVGNVMNLADFSLLKGEVDAQELMQKAFAAKYPQGFNVKDVCYPKDNDKNLAIINYTSGSTGDPKGVMIRYECISANMDYGQRGIPSYPEDNILSILPMAHMFGMAFELLYPLCGGSAVYYLGKTPSPTYLLQAMRQVRPYLVVAVPMIFEKIYRSKLKPVLDKPLVKVLVACPVLRQIIYRKMRRSLDDAFGGKVRTYILGGAAVNPEVESFLRRIGLHFTVGYGMTEAAPLLGYESWDRFVLRSCGKTMDFAELRIDSEDPERIPGEIQAKGVNIFSGYYKNEAATRAAFTEDGWFNTGDLGLIDKDGNIFIKGRSKSMLLSSNGQNIYPEEIESEINNQPNVVESLVVSRNSKLVALLYLNAVEVLRSGLTLEQAAENIRAAVNAKLPKYSQIAQTQIEKDPFKKTPKLSIKRFLYS